MVILATPYTLKLYVYIPPNSESGNANNNTIGKLEGKKSDKIRE